jgi:RNA polymerase sigma-70 factor (ECF subfamily)
MRGERPLSLSESLEEITNEEIDTSERDARLWQALDNLPDRCREIFLLSKRDGLSNAEIASELGISIKTVENQITKAYKALRGELSSRSGAVFFLPFL